MAENCSCITYTWQEQGAEAVPLHQGKSIMSPE